MTLFAAACIAGAVLFVLAPFSAWVICRAAAIGDRFLGEPDRTDPIYTRGTGCHDRDPVRLLPLRLRWQGTDQPGNKRPARIRQG